MKEVREMKVHVLCFFEEKESLIFDFECVCVCEVLTFEKCLIFSLDSFLHFCES